MNKNELLNSKDGKLYKSDDLVKIACDDCKGCQQCCENMGDTILLDPYDIWQFTHKLKIAGGGQITFDLLISEDGPLALTGANGMILPHIKMVETNKEDVGACSFLNEEGRCSIHFCRPGMCRLYPLGRIFSEHEETFERELHYFILNEDLGCPIQNTSNICVKDWIAIEDERYEDFLIKWNEMKKSISLTVLSGNISAEELKNLQLKFLQLFFMKPYGDDFFTEFEERRSLWMR